MKILIISRLIISVVVLSACGNMKPDPIPGFIPGTYTRYSEHEFGSEFDTLIITPVGNFYVIERKWKYERVLDGQRLEPEYKNASVTSILNNSILTEQQTGAHYSFDLNKRCLYSGGIRYDKL